MKKLLKPKRMTCLYLLILLIPATVTTLAQQTSTSLYGATGGMSQMAASSGYSWIMWGIGGLLALIAVFFLAGKQTNRESVFPKSGIFDVE
jgi:hypothetical protein